MIMEVGKHQGNRCTECRLDDLEEWLAGLSVLVGWTLLSAAAYLAWRQGWLKGVIGE